MTSARPRLFVSAALCLLTGAVAACTVDVELGFTCTVDGKELAAGQSFPDPAAPCNTCTCQDDGTLSCTDRPCVCDFQGQPVEIGGTIPADDNCNTCTCGPDLTFACSAKSCVDCGAVPPDCQPSSEPSCSSYPICDLTNNQWVCVESCDCDGQDIPPCEPPADDCYYNGPLCREGVWDCGDLICPNCNERERPLCEDDNPTDNCFGEAFCDGLQWQCGIVCESLCAEDPGKECSQGPPGCDVYPLCQMDGSILCVENCADQCMTPPIECPKPGSPACSYLPVCSPDIVDWVCVESCS